MSLVTTAVLGPLVAACTYYAVGLSGDAVLGNFELVSFLFSPLGAVALVLFCSVGFGLVLLEYAGLILLTDAALEGVTVSARTLARAIVWAAPRLWGLAAIQTTLALLTALPFLALGTVVYWLLLSDADIHYFLAERPPPSGPRSRLSCCSFWRLRSSRFGSLHAGLWPCRSAWSKAIRCGGHSRKVRN